MIQAQGLTRHYGDLKAVQELHLDIPQGQLYSFLGPNGAGKTTTIKMLCGLLRPTQGSITIAGIQQGDDPVAIRKLTGYIPDTPFLYGRLTVTEFFRFTGNLYEIQRSEIEEEREKLFSLFGLNEHEHALVKDLSHGLRQRLVYASTFLQKPQVLFVDEPFIGLDPHSIRLIKDLLKEKTRQGMTVFLTTHILALAEDMADRIGIIQKGRLVAEGTLEELRDNGETHHRLEDIFLDLTQSRETVPGEAP